VKKNKDFTSEDLSTILNIIKYPIISDKATRLFERNKYSFIVDKRANKFTIKKIIQYLFNVNTIRINTLNLPKKKKIVGRFSNYKPQYKKAIITLKSGDSINLFPEM
jgi:large subunit ribosomal protein L23